MVKIMLSNDLIVSVKGTRIVYEDEHILVWWDDQCSAIFQASKVVGCWLEGGW